MLHKKTALPLLVVLSLAQLFVPCKMIFDREAILNHGKEFKFETAPVDPEDPFRGKYIQLNFENNEFVADTGNWYYGDVVFVSFKPGDKGMARINMVTKERPAGTDYLEAKVTFVSHDNKLTIEYPFERFYMDESKAYHAEQVYRKSVSDSTKLTYALVNIMNGNAVLKDVLINGRSVNRLLTEKK